MGNSDKISEKEYKKLKESEEKFRMISSNAQDAIIPIDDRGVIFYWNKAAEKIFGYSENEVMGKSLHFLIAPKRYHKSFMKGMELFRKTGKGPVIGKTLEIEGIRKDGAEFPVELSISSFSVNQKWNALAFIRDITEHKQAEEKYIAIFEHSPIAIELYDSDGLLIKVNKACLDLFGIVDIKEIEQFKLFDDPNIPEKEKEILKGGKIIRYEGEFDFDKVKQSNLFRTTKSGVIHLDVAIIPLYTRNKQEISNYLVQIQDITEHKLAKQKLKDYSRNLEDIVEQRTLSFKKQMEKNQLYLDIAGVMLLVINADGTVKRINKKGCELLGYAEEQIIGKNWVVNFITQENRNKIESFFRKLMAGEIEPVEYYENPILTKEGSEKLIAWHNTILKDEKGNIIGTLSSGEDITERKEKEEEIRLHSKIIENISEGVYLIKLDDGTIVYNNPAFEEMFGYNPGEMIGKDVAIVNAPTDKTSEEIKNEIMGILKDTGEWHGEVLNIKKDGTLFWCYANVSLFDHPEYGRVIVSVHTDISERRKVEHNLLRKTNELEERIKELNCLFVLSKLVENIDLSLEQIFQETVKILAPSFQFPEKVCSRIIFNQKEFKTENFAETEFMIKKNLNVNRKIVGRIEVGYLEENKDFDKGQFLHEERDLITIVSEILTMAIKRKNIEEELQLERDNLIGILNSMEDGVYIVDQNYNLEYVNPISIKKFGQYEGKKCFEYLNSRQDVCPWCKNPEVFKGNTVRWEFYSRNNQRTYDNIDTPLKNIDGSVSKLKISRDITKIKKGEQDLLSTLENLKRANIELERFAYVASHDLQEPLRMIVSFIQLLEKRYKDKLDEDANDFIAFIVDGAKRMQTLINDLLLFSRIGKSVKPFKLIDNNEILGSVINNLKKLIEESNATITYDSLPTIVVNEGEFIQLLQNLISNAIKFHKAEEPPVVHISAKLQKNQWIFSVRDNGIGIDTQYFDRIFIIFQRLHKKDEFDGTGIGLAICKKIIEHHRGKIWVESELGKGSTFYFSIPKEIDIKS